MFQLVVPSSRYQQ